MKSIVLMAAAGLTALTYGCASTSSAPVAGAYDDVDAAKVAMVNQHAKANGIAVYWLNYPQRRTVAAQPTAPAQPAIPAGT